MTRTPTTTPTQPRTSTAPDPVCPYCKRHPQRVGSKYCSDTCAKKRHAADKRKSEKRGFIRRALSEEEKAENKRALSRKYNRRHRLLYLTVVDPLCVVCGKRLLLCNCPPDGAARYERVEVVLVLNLRTFEAYSTTVL